MKGEKGITLAELMIVIAVLGILLGIAGISGKTLLDRYGVEVQMKQMSVDFLKARVSAMERNRLHFVVLSDARYTIYEDRDPAHPASPEGDGLLQTDTDSVVRQTDLKPDFSITRDADQMTFDTRGLMTPGMQTIRVTKAFGASCDCMKLSVTRVLTGVWNGADCITQ